MTIDDVADDGASGENDNVHADVESARGGSQRRRPGRQPGTESALRPRRTRQPRRRAPARTSCRAAARSTRRPTPRAPHPLEVSLNGIANDGEITANELDNVLEDVENVIGGSSNDSFFGSPGANRFSGGLGNDFFDGATGPDVFEGGGNYDTVDYSSRSIRVAVSIDGAANDGTDADSDGIGEEGDNAQADVECVVGGSGDDLLVASDDPNFIEGLWGKTGDDVLRGLGGMDTFRGGPGADVMEGGSGSRPRLLRRPRRPGGRVARRRRQRRQRGDERERQRPAATSRTSGAAAETTI